MNTQLVISLRITHTQNLPRAETLTRLVAATLTEALAADPQLLVTADLQNAAVAVSEQAPAIELPERYRYMRR